MILPRPYFYPLIFFITLLVIYVVCGIFDVLPLPPQSIHFWAQADRASVASIFYHEGMDLFHPRVYNLINGTGYTGMEFPLINFMAACLYKFFGFNDFWYRFLMLCIVSAGSFAAFKIATGMLRNKWVALFLTLLWVLSPVILFYTPNFLADAASMSFIMITWLAFFRLKNRFSFGWLFILFIFGTFASLIKITSSISILCMTGLLIMDYLKWLSPEKKSLFPQKHRLLTVVFFILAFTAAWYQYATYLNKTNFSEMFHLGISPPVNLQEALRFLSQFPDFFLYHYYSPLSLVLILLFPLLLILFFRKTDRLLGVLLTGLGVANSCFIYLQLQKYLPHDYYMLTILPWVFFLFIALGKMAEKINMHKWIKPALIILLPSLLAYNTAYCKRILSYRYDKNNPAYFNDSYRAYYDLKPLMRAIGIERTDTIITLVEPTPNMSLYLMDQKGYCVTDMAYGPSLLYLTQERNAKYLVSNQPDFAPDSFLAKVLGKPILTHHHISIYKPVQNAVIRSVVDSVLDARFVLPYQMMKETEYWGENIHQFAGYMQLPVRNIERLNALKWFRLIDIDLNERYTKYKQNHAGTEQELRANFAIEQKLGREEKYVWDNPFQLWFQNLEHRIE
ncbi:MAG: glycosyltransferase family 39 protein [Bacteroidia bacterium]|nr:glycosyltransferase family 39 protein [Bacteroidia bacterium]